MSTYTVTDAVSQIVLGGQSSNVSIVNNGPSTVYLDDATSVSTLNGMVLPPTGQMTWNAQTPLWAVCPPGGTAQLVINDAAGRIDASRARFWNKLSTQTYDGSQVPGNVYQFPMFECGHCETLLFRFATYETPGVNNLPGYGAVQIRWYDNNQEQIGADSTSIWNLYTALLSNGGGTMYMRIPVVGTYCSITVTMQSGDLVIPKINRIDAWGTDRSFQYADWCSNGDYTAGLVTCFIVGQGIFASASDNVNTQFNAGTGFGDVYLAGLAQKVGVGIQAISITTAGGRRYKDGQIALSTFYQFDFKVGDTNQQYQELILPVKKLVRIQNITGLAGSINWSHTWLDWIPS